MANNAFCHDKNALALPDPWKRDIPISTCGLKVTLMRDAILVAAVGIDQSRPFPVNFDNQQTRPPGPQWPRMKPENCAQLPLNVRLHLWAEF